MTDIALDAADITGILGRALAKKGRKDIPFDGILGRQHRCRSFPDS